MNAGHPLSRFSVPAAALLLTLSLVFLAVHSSSPRVSARGPGAAFPQPAPLPLTGRVQSPATPTAAAPVSLPAPALVANAVARDRTSVPSVSRGFAPRHWPAALGTALVILT